MCDWKNWIWPGLVATAFLTALAMWFGGAPAGGPVQLVAARSLYLVAALAVGCIVGWMTCRRPQG